MTFGRYPSSPDAYLDAIRLSNLGARLWAQPFEVPEGFEWSDAGPFLRPILEPDPEDEEATN